MDLLAVFGQIPTIAYIVFVAATLFAVAEFCMPGFGVCGICAFVGYTVSIVFAARSLEAGIVFALMVLLVVTILVILFSIFASRGRFIKPLMLNESLSSKDGFSSSKDYDLLLGKTGISKSTLRPSGKVTIDGDTLDVVTEGEFLGSDTPVKVIEVSGSRIVVEKLS